MKQCIFLLMTFLCVTALNAQPDLPAIDKSPLDMSYYPDNYPVLKIRDKVTDLPIARVIYSRPKKEGRTIFGELVAYDDVWRLGANEATEIEFFVPVTVDGKKISKGRYTLYAIVKENSWTFIINKDADTWGAFKYDETKDIARVSAAAEKTSDTVETLSMKFVRTDNGFNLVVAWENTFAVLPFSL